MRCRDIGIECRDIGIECHDIGELFGADVATLRRHFLLLQFYLFSSSYLFYAYSVHACEYKSIKNEVSQFKHGQ